MTFEVPHLHNAKRVTLTLTLMAAPLLFGGCNTNAPKPADSAGRSGAENRIADLQVVDCLLPGQVRMLGNQRYITPRRPAMLTAAECRTRGGEYVAFDRADTRTALAVWMPSAEAGDAEAQVNVGEIFEKGLGGTPNFEAAAIWYRKAAEQGNKRAQFNLGTLYEQGHGVEKDSLQALNWYRQAWGLPEDNVIFASALEEQRKKLLSELDKELRKKDLQIDSLKRQIETLKNQASGTPDSEAKTQIRELEALVKELQVAALALKKKGQQALAANTGKYKFREPDTIVKTETLAGATEQSIAGDIHFGKYYALVIGVQNYQNINDLDTPINDINTLAGILSEDYGFEVTKVIDADNVAVMEAINNIGSRLTERDNLLIFYAGHGARLQTGEVESGFWLPTNAEAPPRDTYWVANEFVTRHLSRIHAKRVLVVADSCYAGLLSSAPGFLMMGGDVRYNREYIHYKADKRSRLLLTSGGDHPVLDGDGGKNSIFARAFIEVLKSHASNSEASKNFANILTTPELFKRVREKVMVAAEKIEFQQEPEYKTIKGAGHEVGDFFFVPRKSRLQAEGKKSLNHG